jgi:hypothetical protein
MAPKRGASGSRKEYWSGSLQERLETLDEPIASDAPVSGSVADTLHAEYMAIRKHAESLITLGRVECSGEESTLESLHSRFHTYLPA